MSLCLFLVSPNETKVMCMEYNSGNDCGAWTKEVGLHHGKKNDGLWCVCVSDLYCRVSKKQQFDISCCIEN